MSDSNKMKFWIAMSFIILFSAILLAVHYSLIWIDKINCDLMNGSFSIESDGIIQKTTCIVTERTEISERFCYINGERVDCEEQEEMKL